MFGFFRLYWGGAQLLTSALATYYIAKYNKTWKMPWIVFG
jgi:hypothetical protein